ARAVAQRALAVAAALGLLVRPPLEALQVVQRVVAEQHDVAPAAAVATTGAAMGYMGLTPNRADPVPAGPSLNEDASLVVEHASSSSLERTPWQTARTRSSSSPERRPASARRLRGWPSRP